MEAELTAAEHVSAKHIDVERLLSGKHGLVDGAAGHEPVIERGDEATGGLDEDAMAHRNDGGLRGRLGPMEQPDRYESQRERSFHLKRAVHSAMILVWNLITGNHRLRAPVETILG